MCFTIIPTAPNMKKKKILKTRVPRLFFFFWFLDHAFNFLDFRALK